MVTNLQCRSNWFFFSFSQRKIFEGTKDQWRITIREAFERDIGVIRTQHNKMKTYRNVNIYPFLHVLSTDQYVDIILSVSLEDLFDFIFIHNYFQFIYYNYPLKRLIIPKRGHFFTNISSLPEDIIIPHNPHTYFIIDIL